MSSKAKTVAENLKINPAILSRFDLIFILLDNPDESRDQILSDHVMSVSTSHNSYELVL
jgi:DNA helicase MCM8